MRDIHRLGTWVRLPDGREGTVVFNGLVGVGIKWGLHEPNLADFEGTDGNTVKSGVPEGFIWEPDALLRETEVADLLDMECVGTEWEIISTAEERKENQNVSKPTR